MPHLAYNLFGWLLVFAVWLTSCTTKNTHIENHLHPCDTTVLHNRLVEKDKEVKELRGKEYWATKPRYKVIHDTVYVKSDSSILEHTEQANMVESHRVKNFIQFNPDTYPLSFEYSARTDPFPPKRSGKRISEIRKADNTEWDSLWKRSKDYRREYDSALFKPKQ
jgi:hypothetical protein